MSGSSMPSMQLSRVHASRHRPKGVATSGGAQTTGYQISAERGRKSRWCTNDRIQDIGRKGSLVAVVHKRQDEGQQSPRSRHQCSYPGFMLTDISRKGSQLAVVHKRQDTRYRPKGVATNGGAQTTGYQISAERGYKSRWCTNGRTKVNNYHGVSDNEKT
ncbi:unnamed protein product [Rhizophagus irregularis]|nr:unnamed protein product [Rhizophagus irregularis]